MTTGLTRAKEGACEVCGAPVAHGPWTDEQIAEVCADIDMAPEDFGDLCDGCGDGFIYKKARLLRWATFDYLTSSAKPQQPAADISGAETVNGRDFIVLRNVNGILAVYEVRANGTMDPLLAWPKEIQP